MSSNVGYGLWCGSEGRKGEGMVGRLLTGRRRRGWERGYEDLEEKEV